MMKRLLTLTVVMIVAAAATGCSLFNRNQCDPCSSGYGMGGMGGGVVAPGAGYGSAPVVSDGGYLPTPN